MKLKPPEYSPVLVEIVEEALEPYKKILSPEMLEHFRQETLLQLSMHPYPAALIRKLAPPPVVQESGTVTVKHEEIPAESSFKRADSSRKGGA